MKTYALLSNSSIYRKKLNSFWHDILVISYHQNEKYAPRPLNAPDLDKTFNRFGKNATLSFLNKLDKMRLFIFQHKMETLLLQMEKNVIHMAASTHLA